MPPRGGPKSDRLAALREAREKGGRLSQWKVSALVCCADVQGADSELYDEVTDEQYRSIVGSRLEQDDFIIDDDGSGYVDNGMDDWGGGEDEEESEDEDAFEGEDEEYRKGERCLGRSDASAQAEAPEGPRQG
jgi:DNA polymerase alpha subunit A